MIKIINIALLTLFLLGAFSCKTMKEYNMYSTADDLKYGKEIQEAVKKDTHSFPILKNTKVKKYLQEIVDKILKSSAIQFKNTFKYEVEIINDDNVVNAFAAPGGYIYVYTGLLKFVDNEATLAAVIAHEIAHVERRHATKRMSQQKSMESLIDLYKEKNKNKTTEVATNLFQGVSLLANSREDEIEADEYSFKYLQSTAWYPGAISYFFDKITANIGSGGGAFDVLLSTHPLPKERVEAITQLLKNANINPPNEDNLQYKKYLQFRNSLQ